MDIELLYPLVTDAIRRAETLEELNAPGARNAYLDVSLLEERIARLLRSSDVEGAIARRGAVTAAISAHEFGRALSLTTQFLGEGDVDDPLKSDLEELRNEASSMLMRQGQAVTGRYSRASERYGTQSIRQFIRDFHAQGAPLPIIE